MELVKGACKIAPIQRPIRRLNASAPSYFAASCGSAPISILKQYVEQQREDAPPPRHKRRGFRRGKR
jgi:hypothetical protein